jgi:hypothetical protein
MPSWALQLPAGYPGPATDLLDDRMQTNALPGLEAKRVPRSLTEAFEANAQGQGGAAVNHDGTLPFASSPMTLASLGMLRRGARAATS